MKYRIIVSVILVLICAFAIAMHSGPDAPTQPQPSNTAAPTFNL
jgi:hypothetical protein